MNHSLESLSPKEVKNKAGQIESLLANRSVLVRMEAAQALGRAGIGASALRERIRVEKNALVMTDLTEALVSAGDPESLNLLTELAEVHPSNLVRSYALMAVADLSRKDSLPFLRKRLQIEKGRRIRATLHVLLFVYGADDVRSLIDLLRSRDPTVRGRVANLLAYYRPRRKRPEVIAALAAAQIEPNPGTRGGLEEAIEALGPSTRPGR